MAKMRRRVRGLFVCPFLLALPTHVAKRLLKALLLKFATATDLETSVGWEKSSSQVATNVVDASMAISSQILTQRCVQEKILKKAQKWLTNRWWRAKDGPYDAWETLWRRATKQPLAATWGKDLSAEIEIAIEACTSFSAICGARSGPQRQFEDLHRGRRATWLAIARQVEVRIGHSFKLSKGTVQHPCAVRQSRAIVAQLQKRVAQISYKKYKKMVMEENIDAHFGCWLAKRVVQHCVTISLCHTSLCNCHCVSASPSLTAAGCENSQRCLPIASQLHHMVDTQSSTCNWVLTCLRPSTCSTGVMHTGSLMVRKVMSR